MTEALFVSAMKVTAVLVGSNTLLMATSIPDSSLILNFIAVLLLVVYGPRYVRVARLKQQLEDIGHAYDVEKLAKETTHHELLGAQHRADKEEEKRVKAEKEVTEWKTRFDEQAKYTAQPALEAIQGILEGNQNIFQEILEDNRRLLLILHNEQKERGQGG